MAGNNDGEGPDHSLLGGDESLSAAVGSGYIDDEVDIDDDLDDEPLVVHGSKRKQTPSSSSSRGHFRPSSFSSIKTTTTLPPASIHDYTLRAGGDATREYILGRFVHRMPDMDLVSGMRLFRQDEGRMTARMSSIRADKKQKYYYNSFIGKRRLARNEKAGLMTIPDRVRRPWELEVLYDRDGAEGRYAQGGCMQKQFWKGEFEGRNESRYAVMVMNRDSKTVDVLPIGHLAWYGFRLQGVGTRQRDVESTEEAEKKMVQEWKKSIKKLNVMHTTFEQAQEKSELQMGGVSAPKEEEDVAPVGIVHQLEGGEDAAEKERAEGLDYDQEFDDDDVAQVDTDFVKKEDTQRTVRDGASDRKKFRQLIKDEPNEPNSSSRPGSPGSDSEEDYTRMSPSPMHKRIRPPVQGEGQPPMKRTKREPSPGVTTAAPTATSKNGLSAAASSGPVPVGVYAHLLPQPNEDPSKEHIINILTLIKDLGKTILLREIVVAFGYKAKQKRKRQILQRILKEVAYTRQVPSQSGGREYQVFLKSDFVPKTS